MASSTSLFRRLLWLLLATVLLIVVIGATTLRYSGSRVASDYEARVLATQVHAADVLLAQGHDDRLASLGIAHSAAAPLAIRPLLPMLRNLQQELQAQLPDRQVRMQGRLRAFVWVSAATPGQGWIGLSLPGFRAPLFRTAIVTAVLAGLLVLLIAAAYARSLTRPLKMLADAAGDVVSGGTVPPMPPRAAREFKELHAALTQAAAERQRSRRDRDLMLAALSHDLRTPLARMRLALELAPPGDAALREGMEADIAAIDTLSGQFIDFVRDGTEEPMADVDLAVVLAELVATLARDRLQWHVQSPSTLNVRGRPMALRRAMDNLIANARRHGAPPYRLELSQSANTVRFAVADHGPGVPTALLPLLGEPFVRGNSARSDALGSGLGLASVRRVAMAHSGSLDLENLPGTGFLAVLTIKADG